MPFEIKRVVETLRTDDAQVTFDVAVTFDVTLQHSKQLEGLAACTAHVFIVISFDF